MIATEAFAQAAQTAAQPQSTQDIWLILLSGLGAVTLLLLSYLIYRQSEFEKEIRSKVSDISSQIIEHILNFTRTMPQYVTAVQCNQTRDNCIRLNQRLILDPLKKELAEYQQENERHWERHEAEAQGLWDGLRHHLHTPDGVIVNGKKDR